MVDTSICLKYVKVKVDLSCAIFNKIMCTLPQRIINTNSLNIPTDLKLADPTFFIASKIDLLLGADVYYDVVLPGVVKLDLVYLCIKTLSLDGLYEVLVLNKI